MLFRHWLVGWDAQIFQTNIIKVERNWYWNWIADIKSTEIYVLLKGIKTTDNDSKKVLFIEKCIILAAMLDFSNLYKRRLYENVLFFSTLPRWKKQRDENVQLCTNECYLKPLQLCKGKFLEGSSIFKWCKALCCSESYLWGYMKFYVRMYTGEMTFLSLCLYPRLYSETFGHGLGFSLSRSYGMTDQKLLKSLKRLV